MAGGYEEYVALLEAAQNDACDAYFRARPVIDFPSMRKLFEHGFARGYRAGHDQATPATSPAPAGDSTQETAS